MIVAELDRVSKSFWIPDERRDTIREHVFGALRSREMRRLPVLGSVSLSLGRGEALGIMGANGCGKSTLLKVLCGIYTADTGRVTTRAAITPILDLGIGWNPELDAVDNIYLIGSVMGMPLAQIRKSIDEILAFAELEPFARMYVKHYSNGMAARLAYAVAFQAVREVLVLDEVLAVGDAGFKQRCEQRYRALRASGHTTLVVSHDPHIISSFCDRALLLEKGRFVFEGTPGEVVQEYLSRLTTPHGALSA
jgi:ABC-2 type transport system ATP-binding protein